MSNKIQKEVSKYRLFAYLQNKRKVKKEEQETAKVLSIAPTFSIPVSCIVSSDPFEEGEKLQPTSFEFHTVVRKCYLYK